PEGRQYLQQLGVTNSNFEVIPAMSNKFRQINKFIEIINSILPEKTTPDSLKVVDMGSGKGYLTFALYDHLTNNRNIPAQITGVEMRRDLVEKCNQIAKISDFKNLTFQKSNIQEFEIENLNMLIALHACDTATDDAIYKGITAGADYIVVAPCCHKQVRKSMNVDDALKPVLRHGIFLERQAELLTDGIRSLLLEKYGYKVKTLEFISTEHTPKNVMIIAIKSDKIVDKVGISEQIYQIKKIFGIEYQHLENLLGSY
ncbi:MAG: SAM-dependent methyltransferase, partial [Bacteroidales bacterium]|nr:SAM-dependent methyltransferase [Bacteroidales bacterium]